MQSHNADVWVYDFARQMKTRFTFNSAAETYALWSPDGSRIVFNSNRSGHNDLYIRPTGGAGSEELLLATGGENIPLDWSSDGKLLVYESDGGEKTQQDLWFLPMTGDRKPVPFLQTEFNEVGARFSPDCRWLAYVSDESGRNEVYVRSASGQGGKWQVSADGGDAPRWRRDGAELYYFGADHAMMAADVAVRSGSIEISHLRPLFDVASIIQLPGSDYDVTADGKRFIINVPFDAQNQTPLTLVMNWEKKLEKK
jgi:Tol biopolymer transport system component